jgi:ABC-2 type transport system ATP-binding protein
MSEFAIETNRLSKVFPGHVDAVRDLDLQIKPGTVYGLVGTNGAGKTTTLRLLTGLLRPTGGTAHVLGTNLWNAPRATRAKVAYVSQSQLLHGPMTVSELCYYVSHFYEKWDQSYARSLAKKWDLPWDRQVGLMSGGQQRKASILLAFACRPEILILDEPAAALDPLARRQFIDELIEIVSENEKCTILFSTHIVSDLERVAEYVGIMDQGKIIVSSTLEELQNSYKRVQFIFDEAPPTNFAIPDALRFQVTGTVAHALIRTSHNHLIEQLAQSTKAKMTTFPLGLEELFISILESHAKTDKED